MSKSRHKTKEITEEPSFIRYEQTEEDLYSLLCGDDNTESQMIP